MVPSDINIAKAAKIKPIYEIASQMGIAEENLEYFVVIKQSYLGI